MALNIALRSAGLNLGERITNISSRSSRSSRSSSRSSRSSSNESGRRQTQTTSSSADGHLLPRYRPIDQTDSSFPLRDCCRADSSDINKDDGTTTTIDEIGAQDISTAAVGDFHYDPYSRPQSQTDYLQLSERHRRSSEDGSSNGSNRDNDPRASSDPPTTKGSLLRPFLANFTIGFADGLTTPFALTAGLSWMGTSRLVIVAGGTEISGGCVSMGVGGYLAARGERNAEAREARRRAAQGISSRHSPRGCECGLKSEATEEAVQMSPVMSGLSVGVGFLIGGLLPLSPYFFVSKVRHGLIWSFLVCIATLFLFGFAKEFAMCVEQLPEEPAEDDDYEDYYGTPLPRGSTGRFSWFIDWTRRARRVPSEDVRLCLWDGLLVAMLGSSAAVAAVLCVVVSQSLLKEEEGAAGDEPA